MPLVSPVEEDSRTIRKQAPRQSDITALEPANALLVKRAASGDPEAQAAIFDRYASYLLKLAKSFVVSKENAEDLVHDTFVHVFSRLDTLRNPEALRSWLSQALVRRAISFLRRERLRQRIGLSTVVSETELVIPQDSPLETLEARSEVVRLISKMPAETRIVWWLQRVEGHTIREVTEITGLSIDKVKKRLCAGEKILQRSRREASR